MSQNNTSIKYKPCIRLPITVASCILAALTFQMKANAQELVANGSFSGADCYNTTCPGWSLINENGFSFFNMFQSNQFANGEVTPYRSTLSQALSTKKGALYQIGFTLNTFDSVSVPPYLFRASFGSQVLAELSSGLTVEPQRYTYNATATSDSTSLEFYGFYDQDYWILSSVSVIPTIYTSTAQPYADIQSVSIDALKNQRELVLAQAGECDQNGWVVYDSEKVKGKPKPKKHQSLCVFGEGGYAQGDINGSDTIGGYSTSNASTAFGIEWKPSRKWAMGAAYGYGTANLGNFNFQDTSAYINSDINSGNIYGVYRPGKNWKISALAGYSKFNSNGARTFLGGTANSTFSANGYTGALEASYDIFLGTDLNNKKNKSNPVRIKPLVGIAWGGNQQAGFSETGNGNLLNVQEQMSNSLVATFGASLEAPIPLNKKKTTVLKPRFGIAYQYDFLANQDANKQITASLQDDSTTSFTEVGQNRGINNIYLNLGGDLQVNPRTVVYANVNYQAFSYGNQIGYQGGVRIKL